MIRIKPAADVDSLSGEAEELFFCHLDLSLVEWRQRLKAGRLDGELLSPRLIAELTLLVRELADVAGDSPFETRLGVHAAGASAPGSR